MVEETSAHGLRHVGYGVPTEMFPPFVSGAVSLSLGENLPDNQDGGVLLDAELS